jgi:hypothetical protein
MKKKWQKPELIILARTSPEEAVLAACKFGTINGPDHFLNQCYSARYIDWCYGQCPEILPS